MALPRLTNSSPRPSLPITSQGQANEAVPSTERSRLWNPANGIRFHGTESQSTNTAFNSAAFKQNGWPGQWRGLKEEDSEDTVQGYQGADRSAFSVPRSGNSTNHDPSDHGSAAAADAFGSIGSRSDSMSSEEASVEDEADDRAFSASESSDENWEEALASSQSSAEVRVEDESTSSPLPDPLSHSVPALVLQEALLSQNGDPSKIVYWTHELYKDASGAAPITYYCKKLADSERVAKLFVEEPVLGFDIEWACQPGIKRTIKNNVSLLQLASPSRIGIFHFALHEGDTVEEILPPTLKQIMESPDIIKTGVAIKGDCTRLRTNLDIHSRGVCELSRLHRLVTYSVSAPHLVNRKLVSLKDQVLEHLQLPLAKGAVRTSAWDRSLNQEQTKYAAADAYAGLMLYDVLERKRLSIRPYQARPAMVDEDIVTIPSREGGEIDEILSGRALEDPAAELYKDMAALKIAEERLDISLGFAEASEIPKKERSRSYKTLSKPKAPASVLPKSPATTLSPALQQAQDWVNSYLATDQAVLDVSIEAAVLNSSTSTSPPPVATKPRASFAQLRAYSLWHHQQLSCAATAAILRQPPLQTSTVANYILQAIHCEDLPFDEGQLRGIAKSAGFLPSNLRYSKVVGRYVKRDT